MTGARSARLPGDRLHLQHGPIDLVIGATGAGREPAFKAAEARFQTVLEELVSELPHLRTPLPSAKPAGTVAQRMHAAATLHLPVFVTPMAAVAGSVADEVLSAMTTAPHLGRAYVNNGGDIAFHLAPGEATVAAIAGFNGSDLGRVRITHSDPVRGIATSGIGGRSLSLGIADSVTILAQTAAAADVAATLIANAVNLPDHPAITRAPAITLDPDSDLGAQDVVTGVGNLNEAEIDEALDAGLRRAARMKAAGLVEAAMLTLQGRHAVLGQEHRRLPKQQTPKGRTATDERKDPENCRLG